MRAEVLRIWQTKQKRSFQTILSGFKKAKYLHKKIRFLTLTTSDIQYHSESFQFGSMNKSFQKLKKRIEVLINGTTLKIDEDVLAREVAIFADRSDISEEIARLKSHIQRFTETCQEDGQAGRKLDFITQEMLREANTIASKAVDTEIVHLVVNIKCWIDRIKEQIQNIE